MARKKIDELKRSRWIFEHEMQQISPVLKELAPECKGVNIHVFLLFVSAFGTTRKEIDTSIAPEDKVYFHVDCLNNDCTGHGFSISNQIREALRSLEIIEGEVRCDGKEDWKYLNNTGCSCMGSCKYRIEPLF